MTNDVRAAVKRAVLPVLMILPVFAVLEGFGYALCPAAMLGGAVSSTANRIGWIFARTASAVYDNRGFLFAVCTGYMLSGKKLSGAMAGLGAVLLFNSFSSLPFFAVFYPSVPDSDLSMLALYGPGACTGILLGAASVFVLNRCSFRNHPMRSVLLCAFCMAGLSAVLTAVRIVLFHAAARLGDLIITLGIPGAGVYAFLNRLLSPFELHRALNYAVLYENGAGDMTRFWALVTEGDPGRYMSGFFPVMMFGVPMLCGMLYRKAGKGSVFRRFILLCALASYSCGLCEPLEYWLLLTSPLHYLLYSAVYGLSAWLSAAVGFRAGFACSGGFTDLLFSGPMPAARNTWMVIPLGLLCAALFFLLFRRLQPDNETDLDIIEPANMEDNRQ